MKTRNEKPFYKQKTKYLSVKQKRFLVKRKRKNCFCKSKKENVKQRRSKNKKICAIKIDFFKSENIKSFLKQTETFSKTKAENIFIKQKAVL